jgi:hypothetical protein
MSPSLFSADYAATVEGREARALALVPAALSISDLFAEYGAAVARGDRGRVAELRLAADADLLAELDGFDYPAAA